MSSTESDEDIAARRNAKGSRPPGNTLKRARESSENVATSQSSRKKRRLGNNSQNAEGDIDIVGAIIPSFKTIPKNRKKRKMWKNRRQIINRQNYQLMHPSVPTFTSIGAPPSLLPPIKYCDLTGFIAKYTDPRTGMRFSSKEDYAVIQNMSHESVQSYLKVRNAEIQI